jgi:hypothetical protein
MCRPQFSLKRLLWLMAVVAMVGNVYFFAIDLPRGALVAIVGSFTLTMLLVTSLVYWGSWKCPHCGRRFVTNLQAINPATKNCVLCDPLEAQAPRSTH